jgi:hypothetical protein
VVSVVERLKQKAAVRTKEVRIDGDLFVVREVGAIAFAEYGKLVSTDKHAATAVLLAECVLDDEGNRALSDQDALEIAKSARVTMPLVSAIMEVSGFGDAEKKSDAS